MALGLSALQGSRRANQFAALLDGTASQVDVAPSVAKLAALATTLQQMPLRPSPGFQESLRQTLMTAAAGAQSIPTQLPPGGHGGSTGGHAAGGPASSMTAAHGAGQAAGHIASRVAGKAGLGSLSSVSAPAWAPLAAGGMAAVIGLTGVAIGASRSLPGDPFYSLKRRTEAVQLFFAGSAAEKATAHLGFAAARLHELSELARSEHLGEGVVSAATLADLNGLLDDWSSEVTASITTLVQDARNGSTSAQRTVNDFVSSEQARFTALLPVLPTRPWQVAQGAITYLNQIHQALQAKGAFVLPSGITPSTQLPTGPGGPGGPVVGPGGPTPSGTSGPTAPPSSTTGPGTHPTTPLPTTPPVILPTLPTCLPGVPLIGNVCTPTSVPTLPLPTTLPTLPSLGLL